MFQFKKKKNRALSGNDQDKRDRLFYHDIVNLTHGLILFFNQRQKSKTVICSEEIQALETEVRTLQVLMKNHFNYNHKNLEQTEDWVPFHIAKIAVSTLIQTYLPKESVQTIIQTNILENENNSKNSMIYFPIFFRIMNNLIKNMGEAQTEVVHLHFYFNELGLIIETRNTINKKMNSNEESDDKDQVFARFGIDSILYLTKECGGEFNYEISHEWWANRIFLPFKINSDHQFKKKKAA